MKRFLVAATAAAGLVSATIAQPARAAEPNDPQQFNIGALLAMTGSAPAYGKVMSQGILLAAQEINADGGIDGIKLNPIIEDHQSGKAKAGVDAMKRLLSLHHVQAVLSSFSPPTLAIAPIADREKVFVINGGGVSAKLINASKYMVHNRVLASTLAAGVIERAKQHECKRLAIVHWKTDAGDSARDVFKKLWTGDGREVVAVESVVQGVGNVDTQAAKVRVSRPDCVALGLFQPEVGLVVKRLREVGITVPLIGIEWTPEDAKIAGGRGEGFEYITEVFRPTEENPWSKKFHDTYKAKYGEEPDLYAANYYEGTYVIAELIRRARAHGGDYWDGAKLYEALWENPTMKSVYGKTMTFNRDTGVASKPVALFKVGAHGEGQFQHYVEVN